MITASGLELGTMEKEKNEWSRNLKKRGYKKEDGRWKNNEKMNENFFWNKSVKRSVPKRIFVYCKFYPGVHWVDFVPYLIPSNWVAAVQD